MLVYPLIQLNSGEREYLDTVGKRITKNIWDINIDDVLDEEIVYDLLQMPLNHEFKFELIKQFNPKLVSIDKITEKYLHLKSNSFVKLLFTDIYKRYDPITQTFVRSTERYYIDNGYQLVVSRVFLPILSYIEDAVYLLGDDREIEVDYDNNLYDYQLQALDFVKRNGSAILQMPTGSGKSYLMSKIKNSIIIVPSRSLQIQYKEKYDRETLTYQYAIKHTDELSRYDVIILDEAHHAPADEFKNVMLKNPDKHFVLTTATPFRGDNRDLLLSIFPKYTLRYDDPRLKINRPEIYIVIYSKYKFTNKKESLAKMVEEFMGNGYVIDEYMIRVPFVEICNKIAKKLGIKCYHSESKIKVKEVLEGKVTKFVSTTIFDEGVDLPEIYNLILPLWESSATKIIQIIGRLSRKGQKDLKKRMYILARSMKELYQFEIFAYLLGLKYTVISD
ncbi:putative superfamily 2 helicase [Sulfolobales Beppu virus 1]|nr:putative superfamily 2 helicase [Sulfolobales Beppu virus 1]